MEEFDFLVVGAGIAGVSAAYYLSQLGRTVLIEREETTAYHSTGRSAAIFSAYHGPRLVCDLARASHAFLQNPPVGFCDHALLSARGMLFCGSDADAAKAQDVYSVGAHGELFFLSTQKTQSLVPFLRPAFAQQNVFYAGAQEIDVAALHQGYLKLFLRHNGVLKLRHAVISLERKANVWRVKAGDSVLHARFIINAAGAWVDDVAKRAGLSPLGVVPKRRTVIVSPLPSEYQQSLFPMVVFLDQSFYFKTDHGKILSCPMDMTPTDPQDVMAEEEDVARAAWLLEERTTLTVPRIENRWAGLRTFVADGAPVVDRHSEEKSFIWLAAQGGYGIKTCDALARCAVGLVQHESFPQDMAAFGIDAKLLRANRAQTENTAVIS